MPFPDIYDTSADQNIKTIRDLLEGIPGVPDAVRQAASELFAQVDIVSTQLYDDVQDLKAWRATLDKSYTPTDPFAGAGS